MFMRKPLVVRAHPLLSLSQVLMEKQPIILLSTLAEVECRNRGSVVLERFRKRRVFTKCSGAATAKASGVPISSPSSLAFSRAIAAIIMQLRSVISIMQVKVFYRKSRVV